MRIVQPQGRPLVLDRGEIAVAVQPKLAGRVDAGPMRRMNAFAGRALTKSVLVAEQNHRSLRLALLQRALSAGVVQGLALAFDESQIAPIGTATGPQPTPDELQRRLNAPRRVTLDSGFALAASGEEVVVPQVIGFDMLDLPVMAPAWLLAGTAPPPRAPGAELAELPSWPVGKSLRTELAAGRDIPRAGIVLLEPVVHEKVEGADTFDQCERDLDAEAFEEQLRQDACRLVYYAWPDELMALPAAGAHWRNELAYAVFQHEARLGSAQAMPWHRVGVPLAVVAFNPSWQPLFADRGAVVRAGGRPRPLSLAHRSVANAGDRFLWQARIEQLAEHLAEARAAGADTAALGTQFRFLPPAGVLPLDAVDVRRQINRFFSAQLDIFAAPVPLEQLDLLLEEGAGLAPIDTAVRDRLAVYVPVPQQVFDPKLLVIERPDADGRMGATLRRFVDARADWLRRRQNLRDKQFLHRLGLDGSNVPPAQRAEDDPLRLEDEPMGPAAPPTVTLMHRSALAQGMHQHVAQGLPQALTPDSGDRLYAWVLLDRENPPRQLMLQFDLDNWNHRVYWGASLLDWGTEGTASRWREADELPAAGTWTRLVFPAGAVGLERRSVSGVAFTLVDGRACFGPLGVLRDNVEQPWLTQQQIDAPGVNKWGNGEGWDIVDALDHGAPFEAALGTAAAGGVRELSALKELVTSAEATTLKIAPAVPEPGKPVAMPDPQRPEDFTILATLIGQRGLRSVVADLSYRIDQADDAINQGYLRAQTDLYRLRQSVLKQTQATRFAVSPALTQIADLDNAAATREQLADFYQSIKADKTILRREPVVAGLGAAGVGTKALTRGETITSNVGEATPMFLAERAQPLTFELAPQARLDLTAEVPRLRAREANFELEAGVFTKPPRAAAPPPPPVNESDALTGKAEIRTTSIAARMERPRSIEAKDFTVATRHDVVGKLIALGLDMSELEVTGFPVTVNNKQHDDKTGQPIRTGIKKLSELRINRAELLNDLDPKADMADESAFFYSGVDLSDHTIALLRRAEGVVRRYRNLLDNCRTVLKTVEQLLDAANARLGVIERELAESRQDVATARALLAEEVARANSLNALRDSVIAQHVKFLAYSRVRMVQRSVGERLAAPVRELDSALEPDAVPACLADHGDPPADVAAMIDVARQAPVQWFPAVRPHLSLIDHPQVADQLIAALRPQLSVGLALSAFAGSVAQQGTASAMQKSMQASARAVQSHAEQVASARAAAVVQSQAALGSGMGLKLKVQAIAQAASIADLLAAAQQRAELQRRVAAEFQRISAIAACLHARLSMVRPAIRLEWAERFSQFDVVGDLGDLSTLPRMNELPRDDREDIRELAAWLRGRVDRDNPRAVALMNDLVRVCLLAASHSPTGEIVTGRIVKPAPLNPGIRLEVRPMLPQRVRMGMQVQMFNAQQLTARAVVEDVIDGVASVRVTQTTSIGFMPTLATAVHFVTR